MMADAYDKRNGWATAGCVAQRAARSSSSSPLSACLWLAGGCSGLARLAAGRRARAPLVVRGMVGLDSGGESRHRGVCLQRTLVGER